MKQVISILLIVLLSISSGCSDSSSKCSKSELNLYLKFLQKEKAERCLNEAPLSESEKKEYRELLSLL